MNRVRNAPELVSSVRSCCRSILLGLKTATATKMAVASNSADVVYPRVAVAVYEMLALEVFNLGIMDSILHL